MLTNVPNAVNRSNRLVTLKHPNGMECTVFRKKVLRVSDSAPPDDVMGGMPTIGGMGVLNSEDEAQYEYEEIGPAKVLMMGVFEGGDDNFLENGVQINYNAPPQEAMIECKLAPDDEDFFTVQKNDMVTVYPGGNIILSYQVVGVPGPVAIPPYTRKFVLNPLQDANVGI